MRLPISVTLTRVSGLVPFLVLAAYAFACVVVWAAPAWRPEWDGGLYLMVGRALALGQGYTYLGEPFFLRPPGLPAGIALLFPDGNFDPATLNRVLMGFAAAAVCAIWFSVRVQYGSWVALGVALLVGTNPIFVRMFNFVLSEFPFLTFLFLSFGCLQYAARRESKWWLWAVLGALCISAALYVRTVSVLALPGLLLLGWSRDHGRQRIRALAPLLLVGILLLPWLVYSWQTALAAETPEDQLLAFDYTSITFRQDPGDPDSDWLSGADWLGRLERNGTAVLREVTVATARSSAGFAQVSLLLLLAGGFVVAVRRRGSIQEWFAAAYVALVLTYFVYSFRLLTPLLPFVYLYLLAAAAALGRLGVPALRRLRPDVALPALLFVLLFGLNLGTLPLNLDPSRWGPAGTKLERSWADIARVRAWIETNTSPDSTLLVSRAPVFAVLTGRTAYTYRFLGRLDDPDAAFTRYDPDFVIFDTRTPASRAFERAVARRYALIDRIDSTFGEGALGAYARRESELR